MVTLELHASITHLASLSSSSILWATSGDLVQYHAINSSGFCLASRKPSCESTRWRFASGTSVQHNVSVMTCWEWWLQPELLSSPSPSSSNRRRFLSDLSWLFFLRSGPILGFWNGGGRGILSRLEIGPWLLLQSDKTQHHSCSGEEAGMVVH